MVPASEKNLYRIFSFLDHRKGLVVEAAGLEFARDSYLGGVSVGGGISR